MRSQVAERIGSQRPAHRLLPGDVVTSAAPDVIELAETAGLFLDDWQRWVLHWACAESVQDEKWAAFEVAPLVSRQNGKGSILEARQLAGLFYFHEPFAVHSAHEFKTAHEHFLRMINLIEGCPDLDRQVFKVRRGAGEQAIELKSGERLRFIARSTGSGRGMTGDVVYLDEAFALTPSMMGALMPTLSAVPNPQIWYTSSAPRKESEVLHNVRARGRSGESSRMFFAEWCADDDTDIGDVDGWYQANPALGIRISEEYVRSELDAMLAMPDEFRRERLGIPEQLDVNRSIISADQWEAMTVPISSPIVSGQSFALDVSPTDRAWSSFAVAGRTVDGAIQLEVFDRRPGTSWVVERAVKLFADHGRPLRVEKGGPAGSLVPLLEQAGVVVDQVSTADLARATGQFIDAALGGNLRHLGDPYLRTAVASAVLRHTGDADLWSRRSSRVDITPLVACTLAFSTLEPDAPADEGFYVY